MAMKLIPIAKTGGAKPIDNNAFADYYKTLESNVNATLQNRLKQQKIDAANQAASLAQVEADRVGGVKGIATETGKGVLGILKSLGISIAGTTKAVGADVLNVLQPWQKPEDKIKSVSFAGQEFQTPSSKGADAGVLAREGKYKEAAGKLGEAGLDIVSTFYTPLKGLKIVKAGKVVNGVLQGGVVGGLYGGGYGATLAMQDGKGIKDIAIETGKGAGIGFAAGGVLGGVGGLAGKIADRQKQLKVDDVALVDIAGKPKTPEDFIASRQDLSIVPLKTLSKDAEGNIETSRLEWDGGSGKGILMATPEANENTFAREIGHYFDKKYPEMVDTFKAEVNKLIPDGETNLPEEDFANAVMRVITEPEARTIAPELTARIAKLGIKLETPKLTAGDIKAARVASRKTERTLASDVRKANRDLKTLEKEYVAQERMYEKMGGDNPFTFSEEGVQFDAFKKMVSRFRGGKSRDALLSGDLKQIEDVVGARMDKAKLMDVFYSQVESEEEMVTKFQEAYRKLKPSRSAEEVKNAALARLERDPEYIAVKEKATAAERAYQEHFDKVNADIEKMNADIVVESASPEVFAEAKRIYKRQRAGGATKKEADKVAVRYIRGKETRVRGLASSVERKAIENKLQDSFGDLPEYKKVSVEKQADAANDLLISDRERAIKVALGEEKPPQGLLPESVFVAVENDAIKRGDVMLLKDLAKTSRLVSEATEMGQRLRMLAEREPHSPVAAIERLLKRRAEQAELADGGKLRIAKNKTVDQIEKAIKKEAPKKEDWSSFIESIKCK